MLPTAVGRVSIGNVTILHCLDENVIIYTAWIVCSSDIHPTVVPFLHPPAGAIFAGEGSEINIDANAVFTRNTAGDNGGAVMRGAFVVCSALHMTTYKAVLPYRRALLQPCRNLI